MATEEILKSVHLRYSNDKKPGFTRKKIGERFVYFDTNGKKIKDKEIITRINSLAIPPAYQKVWISPYPNGHIQATAIDARGRKQYRYHPSWVKKAQEKKFEHMLSFAQHLPKIRNKVRSDMSKNGMPREKVLATIVWLLENTLIRVGNEEYEEENNSYGLTTLKNKHAKVSTHNIVFQFKGKSGVYHKVNIKNKKVAKVIRKCIEIPGQDLFQYFDEENNLQTVDSYDVNEYLKEITGEEITAKDFRTWGGTVLAAQCFDKLGKCDIENEIKQNVVNTVKEVSSFLRNRPATCKKYYIHPLIIEHYSKGVILSGNKSKNKKNNISGLTIIENRTIGLLSTI